METPEEIGTEMSGPHCAENKLPDEQAVNILRERTFNEELRTLVTRVTRRDEKAFSGSEKTDLPGASSNDMLRMFHRLFYRVRNIHWKGDATPLADPLENIHCDELSAEKNRKHIEDILQRNSCHGFSILKYDFSAKAYCSLFNSMENIDGGELYIGLHDPLLGLVTRNGQGIFLSEAEKYDGTPVGHRFFSLLSDRPEYRLYMISLDNIEELITKNIFSSIREGYLMKRPSPIFITACDKNRKVSDVYSIIKKDLAMPLCTFLRFDAEVPVPDCGDPAERLIEKLDFFMRMAVNGGADRCVVIGLSGRDGNQASCLAMLSYLFSKLQREMGISAFFLRFRHDRFTVLLRHDRLRMLEQHVLEANTLGGEIFSFEEISLENGISPASLLVRTVL